MKKIKMKNKKNKDEKKIKMKKNDEK